MIKRCIVLLGLLLAMIAPAFGATCAADPLARDEKGDTPLHQAVRNGDYTTFHTLVTYATEHKLSLNLFNNEGQTPLYLALTKPDDTMATQLQQAGATLTTPAEPPSTHTGWWHGAVTVVILGVLWKSALVLVLFWRSYRKRKTATPPQG